LIRFAFPPVEVQTLLVLRLAAQGEKTHRRADDDAEETEQTRSGRDEALTGEAPVVPRL
jgi:hypothetical protein